MAISKAWWDRWWAEDWSWDGLAKKRWQGWYVDEAWQESEPFAPVPEDEREDGIEYRAATLQDYWRRAGCADDLYPMPDSDKRFTLMHMPLEWSDGSKTGKSDPKAPPEPLMALLRQDLAREIRETEFNEYGWVAGADHRLQWAGAILPRFSLKALTPQPQIEDGKIPFSIKADRAAFSGYADFENAAFSGPADFESAAFSGDAYFESAAFSGTANFVSAAFSGTANFVSAAFSGIANFSSAAFSGDAFFSSAAFSGDAFFSSAAFSGYADFSSAAFSGDAFFSSAAFSGYAAFSSAAFFSPVYFSGQGNTVESEAVEGVLKPDQAEPGQQKYEQAKAILWTARRSFPNADFSNTVFFDQAAFDNRDFHSQTSFSGAVFLRQAAFHSSDLHRGMHFRDAKFGFALDRWRSPYSIKSKRKRVWWKQWLTTLADWLPRKDLVTPLERPHLKSLIKARRRLYQADKRAAEAKGEPVPSWQTWKESFKNKLSDREVRFQLQPLDRQNAYYAEVEDCFRTLKHKMEDRRDRGQEARFFKMELLARQERSDDPHVPGWERIASKFYRVMSDFGTSVGRPLFWLGWSTLLFGLIYLMMATWWVETPSWAGFAEAMNFSFGRILPFGPWAEPDPCSAIGQMLDLPLRAGVEACEVERSYWGWSAMGTRLVASFQSLLAIVLVFLSGLAIRRRFQIN